MKSALQSSQNVADQDVFIACEDNLSFTKRLADNSMKLIVTSPPYNMAKAYEKKISLQYYIQCQKKIIAQCVRLLHPTGSLCWQLGNHVSKGEVFPLDMVLYPLFKDYGLKLRNRIIWHFGHGLHCTNRLSGRHETILWFTKSDKYTFNLDSVRVPSKYPNKKHFKGPNKGKLSGNPKGKNPSDVWEIPNVKSNHCEKTIHPCQFPVELVERLVLAMTDTGDRVFDPFVGVGSSIIAAIKHHRIGYGCDTEKQYIEIAKERIGQFKKGNLKLRPMGKVIYDPALPGGGQ